MQYTPSPNHDLLLRHRPLLRAGQALEDHLDLPLVRHGHRALLGRAVALRHDFSACDAVYVALAEALGASLLTGDRSLARAARAHTEVTALPER